MHRELSRLLLLPLLLLLLACGAGVPSRADDADTHAAWPADTAAEPRTLTLLFAGDLMQHGPQIDAAHRSDGSYDYTSCFALVAPEVRAADLAVANLEVTLRGAPYSGYPQFCAPDAFLLGARDAGFDIFLTANNHCLDTGQAGLQRTIRVLDSLGLPQLGTYTDAEERRQHYPLLTVCKGMRLVWLNFTYGTNGLRPRSPGVVNYIDRAQIQADLDRARELRPDVVIACVHWGTEYQSQPTAQQRDLADWLFRQGVDHIIGSHPHVVQPLELRTDSLGRKHALVWSLGNYVSNMSRRGTDGGLMVTLTLEKNPAESPVDSGRAPTTLTSMSHSLVWTSRPALSRRHDYRIIPESYPAERLRPAERARRATFLSDTRRLLNGSGSY